MIVLKILFNHSIIFLSGPNGYQGWDDCDIGQNSFGCTIDSFNIDNKGNNYITYSTSDISIDNGEKTFFYHPVGEKPVPEEPAPVGVLAPLLDKEKMKETTLQIRVILPLIIVILVSFLGLRKALKLLQTILNRS